MIILIVDDEQALRSALAVAFTRKGYEVLQAADGVQGMALLVSNEVDLVITDIHMPEMDGLQLLAWFKEQRQVVPPVIVITGHPGYSINELRLLGASDVFHKPFAFNDLYPRADALARATYETRDSRMPPHGQTTK